MDRSGAEAAALALVNQGRKHPDEAFALVPDSTVEKAYGWVCSVQSRRFLETGDERFMAVGLGPLVVLTDGTVHALGSAQPPEQELFAFEVAHGLRDAGDARPVPPTPAGSPVWVGAQQGDRFPVLAVTRGGLVSVLLPPADLDEVVRAGPELLEGLGTTVPLADIDRVRTAGGAGLLVERHGDVNVKVRFATPQDRDAAFSGLRSWLAPDAPLERLQRPPRQFVEAAGLALLALVLGFALPWMVEAGLIDRTQWLVAAAFNTLGPGGFRLLGAGLAAVCLVWLAVLALDNPVRSGYRVRRPGA